ncbi:MAG: DUF2157 domain-containing protein [Chloroflexi bacterium]|nr:DUF2157 domain-containing protein [Chloroflexota bacterium]
MATMDERESGAPVSDTTKFAMRMRGEIEVWRAEGLISSELAETLANRYQTTEVHRRAFGLSRFSSIIAIFGTVLVGLGVIGLVAVNWDGLSGFAKMGLLIGFTTASYIVGWSLAYRFEFPRTGIAIILLGAILFGASIHLIAQSFNVEVNHPNLVIAWFVGVIPLAYITRSKAVLVLSMILLLSGLGFRSQEWTTTGFDDGAILFWGLIAYMLVGGALFAIGRLHARLTEYQHFARVYEIWGFVIAGIATYILGSMFLWSELEYSDFPTLTLEYWATIAFSVAVSGVVTYVGYRWDATDTVVSARWRWEVSGVLAIFGIALLTLVGLFASVSWFWLPFNAVIIAAVVAMVNAGIRFNRNYLVNIAFVLFSITVISRYFEIGIELGLLHQAMAYIVAGVLLIAMGLGLERVRRRIIGDIRNRSTVS